MTILGSHSIAELEDLLNSTQNSVSVLTSNYSNFKNTWIQRNKAEHDEWIRDWRTFIARYEPVVRYSKIKISAASALIAMPNSAIPAEDGYQELVKARTANIVGPYQKGDLQDLHNRLSTAKGKNIQYSNNPQPRAASDLDMGVYNAANVVLKSGEELVADTAKNPYTWYALGGLGLLGVIALRR